MFTARDRIPPQLWLVVGAVMIAVIHGYALRWTSDDAFITFRYIDQWLSGNGLVYNPGERVEGYTHPLWLFSLAGCRLFGLDLPQAAIMLGLVGYAALIVVVGASYPAAAFILAVHYEMAIWSTGGLETSLFMLEVVLLFRLVARPRSFGGGHGKAADLPHVVVPRGSRAAAVLDEVHHRANYRYVAAGVLSLVIVLTRPDGAILVVLAGILLVLWTRPAHDRDGGGVASPRVKAAALFAAPLIIGLIPYLVWKVSYYGDLLPNTYYAKSGGGAWWSQGFYYVWTYFRGHPSSALGMVALALFPRAFRSINDPDSRALVTALSFALGYLVLFVARVGGDFMYARFVMPVVPLLFISWEVFARTVLLRAPAQSSRARRLRWGAIVFGLVPLLVILETPLLRNPMFEDASSRDGRHRLRGIEDERWYWHHELAGESRLEQYRKAGKQLGMMMDDLQVSVSVAGQASLAYYGRFHRVVEEHGLTEPRIARRALAQRGRPGHEKQATTEELRELEVDFRLLYGPPKDEPYRNIWFQLEDRRVAGELLRYDEELLEALIERNGDRIQAISFPAYFDVWADETAPSLSRAELEQVAADFEGYYFRFNPDAERKARMDSLLANPHR